MRENYREFFAREKAALVGLYREGGRAWIFWPVGLGVAMSVLMDALVVFDIRLFGLPPRGLGCIFWLGLYFLAMPLLWWAEKDGKRFLGAPWFVLCFAYMFAWQIVQWTTICIFFWFGG